MFTQEQQSILSNIKSLVSELEQIDEGNSIVEDSISDESEDTNIKKSNKPNNNRRQGSSMDNKKVVYKEEDEFTEEEFTEEEVEKAISAIRKIMKGDGGTTASDDAEERLEDDIDEESQDNIDEVTKALRVIMGKVNKSNKQVIKNRQPVQKSNEMDEIKKAVLDLTKVVKSVAIDQKEATQAVGNILSGLGVVQKIEKSANRADQTRSDVSQVRKSASLANRNRPINERAMVRRQIAEEVRKSLGSNDENSATDRSMKREDVRKSLRSVMPDIFNVSK